VSDLLSIARRFLTAPSGEKGDKGDKGQQSAGFSPLSPFSPAPGEREPHLSLVGVERWDQRAAIRMVLEADALVARLDIDDQLPAIQNAAATVTSALATRDMETVRFAVVNFAAEVRDASLAKHTKRRTEPRPKLPTEAPT